MSLFGDFNDLLTGNPIGTADAASAANDQANQIEAQQNANLAQQILATQGQQAADNFTEAVSANDSTAAPDPNSLSAAGSEITGFADGYVGAALSPVQSTENGLNAVGQYAGNQVGQIAGSAANAASNALNNASKNFFSNLSASTFIWLAVIIGLFWYFGGIQRRARKVFG